MSHDFLLLRHCLVIVKLFDVFGILNVLLLILVTEHLADFTAWGVRVEQSGPSELTGHPESLAGDMILHLRILKQLVLELLDRLVALLGLHRRGVIGHPSGVVQVVFIDFVDDPQVFEVETRGTQLLRRR